MKLEAGKMRGSGARGEAVFPPQGILPTLPFFLGLP